MSNTPFFKSYATSYRQHFMISLTLNRMLRHTGT